MPYLILLLFATLNASNTFFNKKFQQTFIETPVNFTRHMFYISVLATFFLWVFNGFKITLNAPTLIFAVIYAIIIIISLPLNLIVLNYAPVSLVTITQMAGSVVISSLFSFAFLDTPLSLPTVISIILMVITVILPHLKKEENTSQSSQKPKQKLTVLGLILCAVLFVWSGVIAIAVKLYTQTPGVADSNSWLAVCNAIIALVALAALSFVAVFKKENKAEVFRPFAVKPMLYLLAYTSVSGISAPLSVYALSLFPLPVYTVITSSLGIIFAFLMSLLLFKEKTNKLQIISAITALVAIVVSVL